MIKVDLQRTDLMADPAVVEFIALLNSPEFRRILAALPGYGSAITGRSYSVREALPGTHCISKAVRSSSKKVPAKRATAL
jgi:hypothetical protein